jgi:hypothetical protein
MKSVRSVFSANFVVCCLTAFVSADTCTASDTITQPQKGTHPATKNRVVNNIAFGDANPATVDFSADEGPSN